MNPLISVLMVAYNAGTYLAPAVNSILTQSHSHLELLLVDNASTDSSVATLSKSCVDSRIQILPQSQNLFHHGGLNAGVPHCKGDYVAIMDADDLALPRRLEQQLATLEKAPDLGGCGCAAMTIDSHDAIIGREFTLCDSLAIKTYSQYDMPFIFPTLMIRRAVLAEFPFRTGLPVSHDLDLMARVVSRHRFCSVPEVLFHYRRHKSSTTTTRHAAILACASVVRLAHARRTAGVTEDLESLVAEKDLLLLAQPNEARVLIHYGRQALTEGFHRQAIWHARKAATFGSPLSGLSLLMQSLAAGRNLPSQEQRFLWRFAGLGTVRAYGLQPFQS